MSIADTVGGMITDEKYWENLVNSDPPNKTDQQEAKPESELPPICNLMDFWEDRPEPAPELITGILRKGHKMSISGTSKAGKSMLFIQLAIAIATGGSWIGLQCARGKILYVNLEIDGASFITNRIFKIIEKKHISKEEIRDNFLIWNLKGQTGANGESLTLKEITESIIQKCQDEDITAVFIDPLYKVMTGDENKAGDIAKLCNVLDCLATSLKCSVMYIHHFSKGTQGWKASIDRASGSGVFARDPDAIVTCNEVDTGTEEQAYRVEFTLREFMQHPPINVRYVYPLHIVDDSGELAELPLKGSKQADTPEEREMKKLRSFVDKLECAYENKLMDQSAEDKEAGNVPLKEILEWMKAPGDPVIKTPDTFKKWFTKATDEDMTNLRIRSGKQEGKKTVIFRSYEEEEV